MTTDTVHLNLINASQDTNTSEVVLLARNASVQEGEVAVAWQVIKGLGPGDSHLFNFPLTFDVAAEDSYGNVTPRLVAENGMAFEMVRTDSGDVLQRVLDGSVSPNEVEIRNNLPKGAIDAMVYKDGKVFERKTGLAPGMKAVFLFKPVLYIGVAAQVREGATVNSAVLSQVNTRLDLLGIASADIVWSGGGTGPDASPFVFNLENVQTP